MKKAKQRLQNKRKKTREKENTLLLLIVIMIKVKSGILGVLVLQQRWSCSMFGECLGKWHCPIDLTAPTQHLAVFWEKQDFKLCIQVRTDIENVSQKYLSSLPDGWDPSCTEKGQMIERSK